MMQHQYPNAASSSNSRCLEPLTPTENILQTPIPNTSLHIISQGNRLIAIKFIPTDKAILSDYRPPNNAEFPLLTQQIKHYFQGKIASFSLSHILPGTAFQKKVWASLQRIPIGTRQTYGELAKQLRTSPRAIGNACKHNPLPIIVPCHRIIGKNSIGGFMGSTTGDTIDIKQWLLQHEKNMFNADNTHSIT